MVIAFDTIEDLPPLCYDILLSDAIDPFWDNARKLLRGLDSPLDLAVQRYFSPVRPVRVVPAVITRIERADLLIILQSNISELLPLSHDVALAVGTPIVIHTFSKWNILTRHAEDNEPPW
jgi:hypothetical protein